MPPKPSLEMPFGQMKLKNEPKPEEPNPLMIFEEKILNFQGNLNPELINPELLNPELLKALTAYQKEMAKLKTEMEDHEAKLKDHEAKLKDDELLREVRKKDLEENRLDISATQKKLFELEMEMIGSKDLKILNKKKQQLEKDLTKLKKHKEELLHPSKKVIFWFLIFFNFFKRFLEKTLERKPSWSHHLLYPQWLLRFPCNLVL